MEETRRQLEAIPKFVLRCQESGFHERVTGLLGDGREISQSSDEPCAGRAFGVAESEDVRKEF